MTVLLRVSATAADRNVRAPVAVSRCTPKTGRSHALLAERGLSLARSGSASQMLRAGDGPRSGGTPRATSERPKKSRRGGPAGWRMFNWNAAV